jgi:hypothetical protein
MRLSAVFHVIRRCSCKGDAERNNAGEEMSALLSLHNGTDGIERRGRSVAQAQNTASSAPGETGRKDYDYTTDKHFLMEEELGENCYFR